LSQTPPPKKNQRPQTGPKPKSKGSSGLLGVFSLVVALIALAFGLWAFLFPPQPVMGPPPSPQVVPGGAAERVAKLEKDVSGLMLRLVSLEKELEALKSRAGSVNQLTKLSARVAALQDRLNRLSGEAKKTSQTVSKPDSKPKATKTVSKQTKEKPNNNSKKFVYTVRKGDTLFTVARRYKVRMSQLKKWNNLKRGHVLKVNEKLVIYK
jgi:LysM repeat protein